MLQQRFWGSINFAPRAEADSDCAIMLRNGVGGSTVRLWFGTEWMEPLRDYGSERGKVGEPCDYGSERIWCSRVILWCGTEAFLGGDIMVRNGVGLRVFHGIFCVKFTVLRCFFFNILKVG